MIRYVCVYHLKSFKQDGIFTLKSQTSVTQLSRSLNTLNRQKLQPTNTLIINGLIDPWSLLSLDKVQTNKDTKTTVIHLQSSAHKADMEPGRLSDPIDLKKARLQVVPAIKVRRNLKDLK
jgi:hypothetical protein